jgi:hypothetical protein
MSTSIPIESQLLKFKGGKIALTPELWLALGVASYNHRVLAHEALPIIDPTEVVADLSHEELEAIAQGFAAVTDATALTPTALDATVRITRSLLAPMHVTAKVLGVPDKTRVYLLLQFTGEKTEAKDTSKPRILPAHDFPGEDRGVAEHRKAQQEAERLGTDASPRRAGEPESTGARRTGGAA